MTAEEHPVNQAILIAAECGWQLVQQYPGETVQRGPLTQVTPPCFRAENCSRSCAVFVPATEGKSGPPCPSCQRH